MRLSVFLHVLAMFAAGAASYGPTIMLRVATARRDVAGMRNTLGLGHGQTIVVSSALGRAALGRHMPPPAKPYAGVQGHEGSSRAR